MYVIEGPSKSTESVAASATNQALGATGAAWSLYTSAVRDSADHAVAFPPALSAPARGGLQSHRAPAPSALAFVYRLRTVQTPGQRLRCCGGARRRLPSPKPIPAPSPCCYRYSPQFAPATGR